MSARNTPPPAVTIDLDAPAGERWHPLAHWAAEARALLEVYSRDLGPGVPSEARSGACSR